MRNYDHSLHFQNGHNYHFYKHGGGLLSVVHSPHDNPSKQEGQTHVATAYDSKDLHSAVVAHAKKNGIKMPVGTGLAKAKQGALMRRPLSGSTKKSLVVRKGRSFRKALTPHSEGPGLTAGHGKVPGPAFKQEHATAAKYHLSRAKAIQDHWDGQEYDSTGNYVKTAHNYRELSAAVRAHKDAADMHSAATLNTAKDPDWRGMSEQARKYSHEAHELDGALNTASDTSKGFSMKKTAAKSLVARKGRSFKKSEGFLPKEIRATMARHPNDSRQLHAAARSHVFLNHGPSSPTEHKRLAAAHSRWSTAAGASGDGATAQAHFAMAHAHTSMAHEKKVGAQLTGKAPHQTLPTFEQHAKEVGAKLVTAFKEAKKSTTSDRYFVDEEAGRMDLIKSKATPEERAKHRGIVQTSAMDEGLRYRVNQLHGAEAGVKHDVRARLKRDVSEHVNDLSQTHGLTRRDHNKLAGRHANLMDTSWGPVHTLHSHLMDAHAEIKKPAKRMPKKVSAAAPAAPAAPAAVAKSGMSDEGRMKENQTMSGYEDLFKSELGISEDKYLIDCPHCEHPITKSEVLAKAAKGSDVHQNTQPTVGGSPGSRQVQKIRPGKGGKMIGIANPGVHGVNKADTESDDDEDDDKKKDEDTTSKALTGPRFIGGSRYVQYYDTGEDAAIADMITKGMLGDGSMPNIPLDLNKSSSRNVGG